MCVICWLSYMWFSEMFDFTRFFTLMVENCEWDQMEKWIETQDVKSWFGLESGMT